METIDRIEEGYILLARKIRHSETFRYCKTNDERWMFVMTLILANHKNNVWHGIEIKRGQFITGIESFAREADTTMKQVRHFWQKFENIGFLARKRASKYSTITVLNYDRYQSPENYKGQDKGRVNAFFS